VREATLARVGRLSAEGRRAVDLAAVIGARTTPGLLRELQPGHESAVEEAVAHGVLTDDGTTLGFRHELIRQAVEQSIGAPRRAQLHARVAAALAERAEPDHARIAHHADAADLREMAARHASLAAAAAERVGALSEASLQLERALRLGGGLADDARIDLLIRYARAANFAGRDLEPARRRRSRRSTSRTRAEIGERVVAREPCCLRRSGRSMSRSRRAPPRLRPWRCSKGPASRPSWLARMPR
jgi:predicted ATPase